MLQNGSREWIIFATNDHTAIQQEHKVATKRSSLFKHLKGDHKDFRTDKAELSWFRKICRQQWELNAYI